MTAAEPNRSAHLVERGVERVAPVLVERQHRAGPRGRRRGSLTEMPTSVMPLAFDQRHRDREQLSRGGEDRLRVRRSRSGSVCERVAREESSKRSRSTTVRPSRSGGSHPPGDPLDERRRARRRPPRATSATGRAPAAHPIEPRRRRACTGRGSRLWASACRCRPDARPSSATSAASRELGDLADRRDPGVVELVCAVTGPTPQSRSTGSGCRNSSSPSGGTDEQPVGLGDARSPPSPGTSCARRRP